MIRVSIELIPGGIGPGRHLGTICIANDRTGSNSIGNYRAELSRRGEPRRKWRDAKVRGFPRQRLGAYDLLFRVLREAVGGRNGANP